MTKKLMGLAYIKKGRAECRDIDLENLRILVGKGSKNAIEISDMKKIIARYDEPMYVNPKPNTCPIDGELMRDHTKDELIECWSQHGGHNSELTRAEEESK